MALVTVTLTETLPVTMTETVTETLVVSTVTVRYVQQECLILRRVGEVYYFFEHRVELRVVNTCNRTFRDVRVIAVVEIDRYYDVLAWERIPLIEPYGEVTVYVPAATKITVVVAPEE